MDDFEGRDWMVKIFGKLVKRKGFRDSCKRG